MINLNNIKLCEIQVLLHSCYLAIPWSNFNDKLQVPQLWRPPQFPQTPPDGQEEVMIFTIG